MLIGRPTSYTPHLGAEICERIADGEPLKDICAGEKMPDASTVRRWRHAHAEFRAMYATAREEAGDVWAERAIAEAMTAINSDTAAAARVRFDAVRWYASKLAPKSYGDKLHHAGDDGGPLTVVVRRMSDG